MHDRTFQEDKREVVSAQQAGYDCGTVAAGRIMGHAEPAIRMFQLYTFRALSSQLQADGGTADEPR
jgi:hypothetical protein